jgi:hypothetical protein
LQQQTSKHEATLYPEVPAPHSISLQQHENLPYCMLLMRYGCKLGGDGTAVIVDIRSWCWH